MSKLILVAILSIFVIACSDTNIIVPTSPSSVVTNPSNPGNPTNPIVLQNKVEFRVTGNALGARVRYSTSNDGLAQVTTTLPFVFTMTVNQPSIFLSIEATPTGYGFITYPFMSAQIFVNGNLFREASSADFLLTTVLASGTWRVN